MMKKYWPGGGARPSPPPPRIRQWVLVLKLDWNEQQAFVHKFSRFLDMESDSSQEQKYQIDYFKATQSRSV